MNYATEVNQPTTLVDASWVAERLGVSRWRVYDLTRKAILPKVLLGKSIRFDPDAIERFIASGGASESEESR